MLRLLLPLLLFVASAAYAHPEDEFCVPGEDAMDPALCAALADMDNPQAKSFTLATEPLSERSAVATAVLYVGIGVSHILPGGMDHILFVIALVLACVRLRQMVVQISAFTVAHTLTLALAANGVITLPTSVVEPLIAATIAFVAIENIFFDKAWRWRPALVFFFGLVHGLGFAGFIGALGLPGDQFWSALLGFNVGVELGQLAVAIVVGSLMWILRNRWQDFAGTRQYRRYALLPGSLVIAFCGLWWATTRLLT